MGGQVSHYHSSLSLPRFYTHFLARLRNLTGLRSGRSMLSSTDASTTEREQYSSHIAPESNRVIRLLACFSSALIHRLYEPRQPGMSNLHSNAFPISAATGSPFLHPIYCAVNYILSFTNTGHVGVSEVDDRTAYIEEMGCFATNTSPRNFGAGYQKDAISASFVASSE